MPVGGGFARFSRGAPRTEAATDESESAKETSVSQKDDSDMPWTNSTSLDEAPTAENFDDFGDFSLPMDGLGGGMDFDNNNGDDSSLMGGWGETEETTITETTTETLADAGSEERPKSGIALFKRRSTADSAGVSTVNPSTFATPKPSQTTVPSVGNVPHAVTREITPPPPTFNKNPGVSSTNSGRYNISETATMTNLQLAEQQKLAPVNNGAAHTGPERTGLKQTFGGAMKTPPPPSNFKTPPPPSNFVRPAFMATHKSTLPSETPAKMTQPITPSIQVTAEKERVVPFSSMEASLYPPEEPVLPREDHSNVSGATASEGKQGGVLAKEHDSESFEDLHEAFISKIRDFGYKDASYSHALLEMNLLLGTSHAEMLRTQADVFDLTERMETMSSDIAGLLSDCMKI